MRSAHWDYIDRLITPEENEDHMKSTKKFWQYIKSNKKDFHGVAPLKMGGKISSTPKEKANTLNEQFKSVFSPQSRVPEDILPPSEIHKAPDITISEAGIRKLYEKSSTLHTTYNLS